MTEIVGERIPRLDWRIYPGLPIVGHFHASLNGAGYAFPAGTTGWLVIVFPDESQHVYDATMTGDAFKVVISEPDARSIPHGSKFRVYLKYPELADPILWRTGKGLREGW